MSDGGLVIDLSQMRGVDVDGDARIARAEGGATWLDFDAATQAFGLVTPPYGMCLMVSCAVAKVPLKFALKDTMIMLVPMLLMLAAIIIWPEIPLILPKLIAPELLK